MIYRRPSHLIFDCDGVVVDTRGLIAAAIHECLTAEGLEIEHETVRLHYAGKCALEMQDQAAAALGRPMPNGWVEALRANIFRWVKGGTRQVRDAAAAIQKLQAAGIRLTAVCTGSNDQLTVALGNAGMLGFFTPRLFSAEVFGRDVHHQELFAFASRVSGIVRNQTIVVADNVAAITAAAELGMETVGFTADPHVDAAALAGAGATTFKEMAKLPDILRVR